MKIKCTNCDEILRIDESKIISSTINIACPKCGQEMTTSKNVESTTTNTSMPFLAQIFFKKNITFWVLSVVCLICTLTFAQNNNHENLDFMTKIGLFFLAFFFGGGLGLIVHLLDRTTSAVTCFRGGAITFLLFISFIGATNYNYVPKNYGNSSSSSNSHHCLWCKREYTGNGYNHLGGSGATSYCTTATNGWEKEDQYCSPQCCSNAWDAIQRQ